ncbi:hypothetical protein GCM10023093_12350 [Nemorincola caseinilytica]|uniref:Uncharacterized protein n=1 Tax=Nemorincola caseinilytica TaxID=2054315 RepID=A0ABP8NCG2_9BACT
MQLKPGKGLGDITFGMLPATVEKLLGKPDRIFVVDDEEEEFIYQYNELRTMYTFYKHEKDRLGYIRSSNPAITYNGALLLDQPIKDVLDGPMKDIKKWQAEKYDFFDTYMNEKSWIVLNVEYDRIADIEVGVPLDGDEVYVWL